MKMNERNRRDPAQGDRAGEARRPPAVVETGPPPTRPTPKRWMPESWWWRWHCWCCRRERRLPLGTRGERAAARWLQRRGLRILARNFRVGRDEIDLIAREGDVLVFIEVKTRARGNPAEAVDLNKQRKLARAGAKFAHRFEVDQVPQRFDVVAVVWSRRREENGDPPEMVHHRHAFVPNESMNV